MRQSVLTFADLLVRSPLVRWTWRSMADQNFSRTLAEYRPTDSETVREMMAGRYLLASKLIDTEGLSPFSIEVLNDEWRQELNGFSWLRHFREAPTEAERFFARTLVLDWIGRNARFNAETWAPAVTSIRLMNWLRHMPLLIEGASPEHQRTIRRSLGTQLQSLKQRTGLSKEPLDTIFSAIAILGAALCDDSATKIVGPRLSRLKQLLDEQIDGDGLHKSRNAQIQFALLSELVSIRQALGQRQRGLVNAVSATIARMHEALARMTLGTGEPAYFNGCGQLPIELLVVLQSQNPKPPQKSGAMSGYGILTDGAAVVIGDSGILPQPPFGKQAHAGALSFEFSHGSELVVGNCGPAPADLGGDKQLFRQGSAHSAPTIDGMSAARTVTRGPLAGSFVSFAGTPLVEVNASEPAMEMITPAYTEKYGIKLRRTITLLSEGATLVGQDQMIAEGRGMKPGKLMLRFHLAPGAEVERARDEDIYHITLNSGSQWTFLWEGGTAQIDESVRQSAYFGFFRTKQIVVEADVAPDKEISWIFTRQNG